MLPHAYVHVTPACFPLLCWCARACACLFVCVCLCALRAVTLRIVCCALHAHTRQAGILLPDTSFLATARPRRAPGCLFLVRRRRCLSKSCGSFGSIELWALGAFWLRGEMIFGSAPIGEGLELLTPSSTPETSGTRSKVLTFNVLFELFGDVETHMEAVLQSCRADSP